MTQVKAGIRAQLMSMLGSACGQVGLCEVRTRPQPGSRIVYAL